MKKRKELKLRTDEQAEVAEVPEGCTRDSVRTALVADIRSAEADERLGPQASREDAESPSNGLTSSGLCRVSTELSPW